LRVKTILSGALGWILLLTGCQFPLQQKTMGFQLTLNFSEPSTRSGEASRLLLPTASTVQVTVSSGGNPVDSRIVVVNGQATIALLFQLTPLQTYDLKAEAHNASGALVFAGSTTVQMVSNLSGTLYLFPVDAAGSRSSWPVVNASAAQQPAGAGVTQGLSLAAGATQSFLFDGSGASEFTFQTQTGLQIYVQKGASGAPVALPASNKLSMASVANSAVVTYYAPSAPVSLSSLGWFAIPLQSVASDPPTELFVGGSQQLGLTVSPTNADHQGLSDFSWNSTNPAVATVDTSGKVTAIAPGVVSVTLTSNHVPSVSASVAITVKALATVTNTVGFAPTGYDSLSFATAATIIEGEDLPLSTSDSSLETGGTGWIAYVDNATVPSSWGSGVLTIETSTLPAGTHFLDLFVTWKGTTYNGSLTFTVLSKGAP